VAVEWLVGIGEISADMCPISTPKGGRHIVNTKPIRPSGAAFMAQQNVSGLWIDRHGSGEHQAYMVKSLFEVLDLEPETVPVHW
jgi:hypothetical protein